MARKKNPNKPFPTNGYTELQNKILRGEIEPDQIDGRFAYLFLKKAEELNDGTVIPLAQKLYNDCKERSRKKNIERAKARHRHEPPRWVAAKNGYSKHHIMVVRGEVPLDSVHTNELVNPVIHSL